VRKPRKLARRSSPVTRAWPPPERFGGGQPLRWAGPKSLRPGTGRHHTQRSVRARVAVSSLGSSAPETSRAARAWASLSVVNDFLTVAEIAEILKLNQRTPPSGSATTASATARSCTTTRSTNGAMRDPGVKNCPAGEVSGRPLPFAPARGSTLAPSPRVSLDMQRGSGGEGGARSPRPPASNASRSGSVSCRTGAIGTSPVRRHTRRCSLWICS
jgi:hypothetical protein